MEFKIQKEMDRRKKEVKQKIESYMLEESFCSLKYQEISNKKLAEWKSEEVLENRWEKLKKGYI